MTTIFPTNNLPTGAQPWAREIQKQLSNVIASNNSERINNTARDNQINSSVVALNSTIQGLIGLGATGSGYTINADNINGGTITGTTLQTSASGQRVVVSNLDEIKFYDNSGTLSLTMEGTGAVGDGTFAMYSRSLTNTTFGFPGSSIYINDDNMSLSTYVLVGPEEDVVGTSIFMDANPSQISINAGTINLNGFIIDGNGNFDLGDISVSSIESSGQIDADGNVFGATLTAKNNGAISGGSLYTSGQVNADGNVFGATVTAKENGGIFGGSVSTTGAITSGGNMRSGGTLGRIELDNAPAVTGASINTNGNIFRTSSSERYKTDISPLDIDYLSIINAPNPKTFRLKDDVFGSEENNFVPNDNARYYAGFIAEDFADTDLDIFISHMNTENGQIPDGFYYAEFTSALLIAIKKQHKIIEQLTNRIETLEKGA